MRKVFAALAAWLLFFASGSAFAETCTKSTATTVRWAAATDALWSGCTPDATDDFVVSAGRVETSASFSVASLTGTAGVVRFGAGTVLTATNYLRNQGARFIADGQVRYEGRVVSTTINGGATPTTVLTMPSTMTTVATTSDFVVVRDDDPTDLDAPILDPPQIGTGLPQAGRYRWSPEKWRWYPITAVSGKDVTISTDAFADVESGLPIGGTSTYSGTRGPALPTAATFTNVGPLAEGIYSEIDIDFDAASGGAAVVEDGDLADQIVEITSGACTGWRLGIHFVDAQATTTPDKVYVDGDTSSCGATFSARVHSGLGAGDKVAIVRAWTMRGSDTAHVEWSGGQMQFRFARFVRLDDQAASVATTENWGSACTFCIFPTSTTSPDFARSWMEDFEIGYANTDTGTDTGGLAFINWNNSANGYLTTKGYMDATGFRVRRYYAHDQANNGASNGWHGLWLQSTKGLDIAQYRCERNGDDCAYGSITDWDNGNKLDMTLRHFIGQAELTPGATSQQCLDLQSENNGTGTAAQTWVQAGALKVADLRTRSCDDLNVSIRTLGADINRISVAGSAGKGSAQPAPGISIADLVTLGSALPTSAIATLPNKLRNSLVSVIATPAASANSLIVGADISDSIFYGGDTLTTWAAYAINPVGFTRTYMNLGTSAQASVMMRRGSTTVGSLAVPLMKIVDSVFLKDRINMDLCERMDGAMTGGATNFEVTRLYFAGSTLNTAGILAGCLTGGASDSQTFRANGLTIAATTANNYGVGRGAAGEGTGEGARIENALVETTGALAPTSQYVFGAKVTDTSEASPSVVPDVTTTAGIAQFMGKADDVRLPRSLGLAEFGAEQAMNGDAWLATPERWASPALLEQMGVRR